MNKESFFTALLAAVVGGLLVLTFGGLVGNQSDGPGVGAGTRFPNGLSVDSTSPSAGEIRSTTLTTTGAATIGGALSVTGAVSGLNALETVSTDNTLTAAESGLVTVVSASGSTTTLPAATAGARFLFVVGAAFDTNNFVIDSAEGDNIEGILMVNDADVVCAGEDQINLLADGEVVGDRVELISDGTSWFILDSDIDAAGKGTCTDPT